MRSKEKLVKVRDEAELRPGMIVVVKPCEACGAQRHRAMLLRKHRGRFVHVSGERHETAWTAYPPAHEGFKWAIHIAVADGRLYRVIDGLERDAETTKDREVERVR